MSAADRPPAPEVHRTAGRIQVRAAAYRLTIGGPTPFGEAPYARLTDPAGRVWADLALLASVDTTAGPDETHSLQPPRIEPAGDGAVLIRVAAAGTGWQRREVVLRCTASAVELWVEVTGAGRITELTVLGGRASLPSGACGTFRSGRNVAAVLVPAATEPVSLVRPAGVPAVLSVVGDADPGRLHAVFSPPPLVLGLGRSAPQGPAEVPPGDWLGLSVRAPVADLTFTALHYEPLDGGFLLRCDYQGHTAVDGTWVSPVFVLRPAADGWSVLDDYRADLVAHGCAPAGGPPPVAWWREPIFCGWGAQCARAAHRLHPGTDDPAAATAPEATGEEDAVVASATDLARSDVYDEFLAVLAGHGLAPGTVVLDDRWQAEYGTAEPDLRHWPDLRGWIAGRHAAGQKVLLWWKAWDPAGLPPGECVRDAAGRPVTVDPGNPDYLARLRRIVHRLLGPDGLDADGFKVDFTQRGPSGGTLQHAGGPWGIAGLHALLAALHGAAHEAKPDALVVCHAVHPAFADVCDMVRLNDVSKADPAGRPVPVVDQLTARWQIARRALPHHLLDTDQWPMPNRAEWLRYVDAQAALGVPALYYLESIDRSGEPVQDADLAAVAASWRRYRADLPS